LYAPPDSAKRKGGNVQQNRRQERGTEDGDIAEGTSLAEEA
jgi:hypothetical protein